MTRRCSNRRHGPAGSAVSLRSPAPGYPAQGCRHAAARGGPAARRDVDLELPAGHPGQNQRAHRTQLSCQSWESPTSSTSPAGCRTQGLRDAVRVRRSRVHTLALRRVFATRRGSDGRGTPMVASRVGALPGGYSAPMACAELVRPGDIGELTSALGDLPTTPRSGAGSGDAGRAGEPSTCSAGNRWRPRRFGWYGPAMARTVGGIGGAEPVDFNRLGVRRSTKVIGDSRDVGAGRRAFEAYRRGADVVAFDQDAGELGWGAIDPHRRWRTAARPPASATGRTGAG